MIGDWMMRQGLLIVSLLFLFAASAFAAPKANDPAPAFSLKDKDGMDFSLSDVVGANPKNKANGVILGFFASWCVPCRNELPILNSLVDELKGKGVKIVIIGFMEDFDTIKELLAELKVSKPLALSDQRGAVAEKYGVRFLPVTFFIGSDGKIKDVIYGEISGEKELREKAGKLTK
jgi:cytochrome c biogenesis protein CcmG, thiol:disulfide interchange protein DsbE